MRTEILQRHRQSPVSGSICSVCGGLSHPAVRTRNAEVGPNSVLYLVEAWACSVCGRQWEDATLRRLNGRAADTARAGWIARISTGAIETL
jgi:hypothetical protein